MKKLSKTKIGEVRKLLLPHDKAIKIFWMKWILSTAIGYIFAAYVGNRTLHFYLNNENFEYYASFIAVFICFLIILGIPKGIVESFRELSSSGKCLWVTFDIAIVIILVFASTIISEILDWALEDQIASRLLVSIIYSIVYGLLIGIAQWVILRGVFPRASWWILATSFGFMFGLVASNFLFHVIVTDRITIDPTLTIHIAMVIGWFMAGFFQWVFLNKHRCKVGKWIFSSVFAYVFSVLLTHYLTLKINNSLAITVIEGILIGIVSGRFIVWVIQQPINWRDSVGNA